MTEREFIYWLKGFLAPLNELSGANYVKVEEKIDEVLENKKATKEGELFSSYDLVKTNPLGDIPYPELCKTCGREIGQTLDCRNSACPNITFTTNNNSNDNSNQDK